jgi:NADH-quinone oxidoreductase subunit L
LAGICLAYLLFARSFGEAGLRLSRRATVATVATLAKFGLAGWEFDRLYHALFVRPFVWAARANKNDVIDWAFSAIAWSGRQAGGLLSRTQSGHLRYYVAVTAAGVLVLVALVVFG